LNLSVEKPYYFQYYTGYVGGGGVHHLCWYNWRNSNSCNLYPHLYPLNIGLVGLIF